MKKIFRRVSAVVVAFAVALTMVVFDVPERVITAAANTPEHTAGQGHDGWTEINSSYPFNNNRLSGGKYYLTEDITLPRQITITGEVTLCLNGHTITAASGKGIFKVDGTSLDLYDCDTAKTGKLTGGTTSSGFTAGGVTVTSGTFNMYGGTITGNTGSTSFNPGGVYVNNTGTFNMYGGTISENSANMYGGGVFVNGIFNMYGGDILDNTSNIGGGVHVNGGIFTMDGGKIYKNTANAGGGVCVNAGGTFNMNAGGTISENTASNKGGGVYVNVNENGNFKMSGGTISENTASNGGGVYVEKGTFEMSDGTISENKSEKTGSKGGGVYVYESGIFEMSGGTISKNNNAQQGGGVYIDRNGGFTMKGGAISENNADGGGGVYVLYSTFAMENGTISDNSSKNGGGVYVYGISDRPSTFKMTGGTISGNSSSQNGGGVYNAGTFTMENNSAISNNTSSRDGGGVYVYELSSGATTFTMSGGAVSGNTATTVKGCGVYYDSGEITLNGTVSITGNGTGDSANDVYLAKNRTLTIGDSFAIPNGEKIGITSASTDCSCAKLITITNTGISDLSGSFKADNKVQQVVYNETDQTLQLKGPHNWNTTTWKNNESSHWHACANSTDHKGDEAEHTWGEWTVKKDATETYAGEKEHQCQVCNYKATVEIPPLVWGDWEITKNPSFTETGTAKRVCENDPTRTEETTLPVLTDEDFWTKGNRKDPTLDDKGSEDYTNTEYGKVTVTIPELNDDEVWTKDDTQHIDPTEEDKGKDVYTSTDYGDVTVVIPELEHTHVWGDWTITKKPTFTATGTAKRVCTKNDAHTETKTLPVLTDTSVWTKDNNKHVEPTEQAEGKDVYTSEYGDVPVILPDLSHTHTLTHVPEVPPTEDAPGTKEHWRCDDCGKDFLDENGNIEATADDLRIGRIGKIETEVQAPENVPKPEIATPKEEFISAVLTQEEQEKVKEGADIKIILKIEDASESAPAEDKEKIDTAIGGLEDHKLGLYLDITLLKKIGEREHEAITNTSKPIAVTFEIPENLRGMAKYSVIRIHNGETTVLEDEDDNPDTITVKSDKFSTYALTYQDNPAQSEPSSDDASSGNDNLSGGDNSSDNNSSDTASNENDSSDSSSDAASSGNDNSNSASSNDESTHTPSGENSVSGESDTGDRDANPSTGIAISFVPLTIVAAAIIAAAKRKNK